MKGKGRVADSKRCPYRTAAAIVDHDRVPIHLDVPGYNVT